MSETNPLNLDWRQERYRRFYVVVDALVQEIQETGPKRKVTGEQLRKLTCSVETLVRDAVAVVLQRKRKGEVPIHLGKGRYGKEASNPMLTYEIHVERAFKTMLQLGYLEETRKGYYDRGGRKDGSSVGRVTRYRATDKLIDCFTEEEQEALPAIIPVAAPTKLVRVRVKQRDDENRVVRKVLPIGETDEIRRMEKNLRAINNILQRAWFDLELSDEEMFDLRRRLAEDPNKERPIALSSRGLYRVFNDVNLTTGGRFYGGWWQGIPSEIRALMLVNGKRMVEFDYSTLHPTILYDRAGGKAPTDSYSNLIQLKELPTERSQRAIRGMFKAAFNAMLNAERPLKQAPKGITPKTFGLTWAEVSDAIIKAHAPIADQFYTGVGLRLQRVDSDIAELVMLEFADMGVPVLPVHDSFLVHNGWANHLREVMGRAYAEVVGGKAKIDAKRAPPMRLEEISYFGKNTDTYESDFEEDVTYDIVELLAKREGHERRLDAFLATR